MSPLWNAIVLGDFLGLDNSQRRDVLGWVRSRDVLGRVDAVSPLVVVSQQHNVLGRVLRDVLG